MEGEATGGPTWTCRRVDGEDVLGCNRGLPSPPHSSASPSVKERGNGSKVKNLRDRLSFSSSSSTRASCWGSIGIHRTGRSKGRTASGGHDAPPAVRAIPSRACAGDRTRCGSGGKADAAAGARYLVQHNDFYCQDCNTHR